MLSYIVMMAACVTGALSQVTYNGTCNVHIQGLPMFNVTGFLGTWHQIERIRNSDETGNCATVTYSLPNTNTSNNTVMLISNREVVNKEAKIRTGAVSITNTTGGTGTFVLRYTGSQQDIPYYVLISDYTGFALLYSCINTGNNTKSEYVWKIRRNVSNFTTMENMLINGILSQLNPMLPPTANTTHWVTVGHSNTDCRVNAGNLLQGSIIMLLLTLLVKCYSIE